MLSASILEGWISTATTKAFVKSPLATRLWTVHKEAGRSWPVISEDEVTDYLVMEAVSFYVGKEQEKLRKKQEIEQWKRDRDHLKRNG